RAREEVGRGGHLRLAPERGTCPGRIRGADRTDRRRAVSSGSTLGGVRRLEGGARGARGLAKLRRRPRGLAPRRPGAGGEQRGSGYDEGLPEGDRPGAQERPGGPAGTARLPAAGIPVRPRVTRWRPQTRRRLRLSTSTR